MRKRLLSRDDLINKGIPFSRVHLWRLEKAGKFPKRVPISASRHGWADDEIDGWIADRIRERAAERLALSAGPAVAASAAPAGFRSRSASDNGAEEMRSVPADGDDARHMKKRAQREG
jgi:prophage regulatory protein